MWGKETVAGQVGIDGISSSTQPRIAPLLSEAVAVAAGMTFTLWLLRSPGDVPLLDFAETDEVSLDSTQETGS